MESGFAKNKRFHHRRESIEIRPVDRAVRSGKSKHQLVRLAIQPVHPHSTHLQLTSTTASQRAPGSTLDPLKEDLAGAAEKLDLPASAGLS